MKNKANRIMGLVRRSFRYLDNNIFTKLYKALVCLHLEYTVLVWCAHFKKDIRKIESVQRHATKQINGLRDLSYDTSKLNGYTCPHLFITGYEET